MRVKTENAVNGKTTEDILNENGGMVLPAGVQLSEALVNALLNQNILHVDVELGESPQTDNAPTNEKKKSEVENTSASEKAFAEYLDFLFLRHRGQFMKEFKQCLLQKSKQDS